MFAPRLLTTPRMPMTHSLRSAARRRRARRAAHRRGPCELGIEDELRDPFAVAKVDEDAAAVIAVARDPTEEDDVFAFVGRAKLAAVVRALQLVDESGHVGVGTVSNDFCLRDEPRMAARAPDRGGSGSPFLARFRRRLAARSPPRISRTGRTPRTTPAWCALSASSRRPGAPLDVFVASCAGAAASRDPRRAGGPRQRCGDRRCRGDLLRGRPPPPCALGRDALSRRGDRGDREPYRRVLGAMASRGGGRRRVRPRRGSSSFGHFSSFCRPGTATPRRTGGPGWRSRSPLPPDTSRSWGFARRPAAPPRSPRTGPPALRCARPCAPAPSGPRRSSSPPPRDSRRSSSPSRTPARPALPLPLSSLRRGTANGPQGTRIRSPNSRICTSASCSASRRWLARSSRRSFPVRARRPSPWRSSQRSAPRRRPSVRLSARRGSARRCSRRSPPSWALPRSRSRRSSAPSRRPAFRTPARARRWSSFSKRSSPSTRPTTRWRRAAPLRRVRPEPRRHGTPPCGPTLPAEPSALVGDERAVLRARAARAEGRLRADLVLVDLDARSAARGGATSAWTRRFFHCGATSPWPASPTESSLSSLATLRPLFVTYDPRWGAPTGRHLIPATLLDSIRTGAARHHRSPSRSRRVRPRPRRAGRADLERPRPARRDRAPPRAPRLSFRNGGHVRGRSRARRTRRGRRGLVLDTQMERRAVASADTGLGGANQPTMQARCSLFTLCDTAIRNRPPRRILR